MTYDKFIQDIIDTRGQWVVPRDGYWENHHIIPRCMGGDPEKPEHNTKHPNLIWLTPEEHFKAHLLLAQKYPDNPSILFALSAMSFLKNDIIHTYQLTEAEYGIARRANAVASKLRWESKTNQEKQSYSENMSEILRTIWNNKSEDERRLHGKKCQEGLDSRTAEQKIETSQKRSKTLTGMNMWTDGVVTIRSYECPGENWWRGQSPIKSDAQLKGYEHVKNALLSKTEEEWALIVNKRNITIANKTEKEKAQTSKKHSEAQIGGKNPCAVKIRCVTTGQIFDCIKDAVEYSHTTRAKLDRCLKKGVCDNNGNFWERL